MVGFLRSIWEYRGYVSSSIRNEFVLRFGRSRLGGLWMIIHPLAQVAIYALILSRVLAAKLPGIDSPYAYSLYLMAGILAWSLFAEIIGRSLTIFIENGSIMKKIRFPRITLPVILVGSCSLNYFFLMLAILVVFAILGHPPNLQWMWLFPLTLVIIALATGLGLVLGILNVFIRDVGQVVPIVLQILFWLTPIVYPASIIPDEARGLIEINPMFPIVTAFQDVLVYSRAPDLQQLAFVVVASVCLMLLGLFMFRRATPEMVDVL